MNRDPWRRNPVAVTAASFMGFAGVTPVIPFLPWFIRELGVFEVGEIARWTGFKLGVTPAVNALVSPFWGRLADQFGRKIMVGRSLLPCVLVMASMTAAYAAAAAVIPAGAHGMGLGVLTSASLTGLAVSPVAAGFLGAASMRVVFIVDAVMMAGLARIVRQKMI